MDRPSFFLISKRIRFMFVAHCLRKSETPIDKLTFCLQTYEKTLGLKEGRVVKTGVRVHKPHHLLPFVYFIFRQFTFLHV